MIRILDRSSVERSKGRSIGKISKIGNITVLALLFASLAGCSIFLSNEARQERAVSALNEQFGTINDMVPSSASISYVDGVVASATTGTATAHLTFTFRNETDLDITALNAILKEANSGQDFEVDLSDCNKALIAAHESVDCTNDAFILMTTSAIGGGFFGDAIGRMTMQYALTSLSGRSLTARVSSIGFTSKDFEGVLKYPS